MSPDAAGAARAAPSALCCWLALSTSRVATPRDSARPNRVPPHHHPSDDHARWPLHRPLIIRNLLSACQVRTRATSLHRSGFPYPHGVRAGPSGTHGHILTCKPQTLCGGMEGGVADTPKRSEPAPQAAPGAAAPPLAALVPSTRLKGHLMLLAPQILSGTAFGGSRVGDPLASNRWLTSVDPLASRWPLAVRPICGIAHREANDRARRERAHE